MKNIDKKNKTVTVEIQCGSYHNITIYTQKDLFKKVKKLCNDFIKGKVTLDGKYDYDEWTNSMKYNLELLMDVL